MIPVDVDRFMEPLASGLDTVFISVLVVVVAAWEDRLEGKVATVGICKLALVRSGAAAAAAAADWTVCDKRMLLR